MRGGARSPGLQRGPPEHLVLMGSLCVHVKSGCLFWLMRSQAAGFLASELWDLEIWESCRASPYIEGLAAPKASGALSLG